MGLAESWGRLWSQHRNAVLAAGGAAAVGAGVIVRRRGGASGDPAVGYPQQVTGGGALPATYDTTATDTYGEFTDQLGAVQDWQAQQFDAVNTAIGGLGDSVGGVDDSVDALGRRVTRLSQRVGKLTHQKPVKAPRPKKKHQAPKAHHKPTLPPPKKTAKKTAARRRTSGIKYAPGGVPGGPPRR